jgi:hypothetical protein
MTIEAIMAAAEELACSRNHEIIERILSQEDDEDGLMNDPANWSCPYMANMREDYLLQVKIDTLTKGHQNPWSAIEADELHQEQCQLEYERRNLTRCGKCDLCIECGSKPEPEYSPVYGSEMPPRFPPLNPYRSPKATAAIRERQMNRTIQTFFEG